MSIINCNNFVKFAINNDEIFIIYDLHVGVKLSFQNFVLLSNFILKDPFSLKEGNMNINIPFLLFKMQCTMRNNQYWSYCFETKKVHVLDEKKEEYVCPSYIFTAKIGERFLISNDTRTVKSRVFNVYSTKTVFSSNTLDNHPVEEDVLKYCLPMSVFLESRNLHTEKYTSSRREFAVPEATFHELFKAIRERSKINVNVENENMIDFVNRIVKDHNLILLIDCFDYQNYEKSYMYMNFKFEVPTDTSKDAYWLTGKTESPLISSVAILSEIVKNQEFIENEKYASHVKKIHDIVCFLSHEFANKEIKEKERASIDRVIATLGKDTKTIAILEECKRKL